MGVCTADVSSALARCHVDVKPAPDDGIVPTKLYCTNANVDEENLLRLKALPGPKAVESRAIDNWITEAENPKSVMSMADKKAPAVLPLRVGAQVMLSRNMPELGLVNGSRGVVTEIVTMLVETGKESYSDGSKESTLPRGTYHFPIVLFDNGRKLRIKFFGIFFGGRDGALVRVQLPLKLAWALTVHKVTLYILPPLSSTSPPAVLLFAVL